MSVHLPFLGPKLMRALPGAPVPVGQTPRETLWQRDKVQLWRYANEHVTQTTPVLLVMSVITRSYILDLRPGDSVVEQLLTAGYDVYLIDWGIPDVSDSENTLETYVDGYLPSAVDAIRDASGRPTIAVIGYCLGGLLSLLCAASNPDVAIDRIVLLATPVDFSHMGLPVTLLRRGRLNPSAILDDSGNVPARMVLDSFRLRNPTAELVQYVNLLGHLDHEDYLLGHRALGRWVHDHIPLAGALACQMVDVLVRRNQLMNGHIQLGGRRVSLENVTCPVLNVMAEKDDLVPVPAAEPLGVLLRASSVDELRVRAGHVALLSGRIGRTVTVPALVDWLSRRRTPASPALAAPPAPAARTGR